MQAISTGLILSGRLCHGQISSEMVSVCDDCLAEPVEPALTVMALEVPTT